LGGTHITFNSNSKENAKKKVSNHLKHDFEKSIHSYIVIMVKVIIRIKSIKYLNFLIISYFTLTFLTVIIAGQPNVIALAAVRATVPLDLTKYII